MNKRVGGGALFGAAVVVSAWLAWSRSPAIGQAEPIPPPRAPGAADGAVFNGVASCSSMACHHFNGPKGSERSEYSTWAGWDKHGRAFAVLDNERSRRIVKNFFYNEAEPEKIPATRRELCLRCHSTFTDNMLTGERFQLSDGVGCESCHGPSGNWLTVHFQRGFKGMSVEDKAKVGLWPTKNLAFRAQLCTTCHVGDGSKEVNHDLIAAGHPRLNFELGGYHGIYHKHWNETSNKDPNKNQPPDFEARLWKIGQFTSAKAAVDLLALRAETSKLALDKGGRPWPEFAEYACYSCHKSLPLLEEKDAPRLEQKYKGRRAGSFLYGTWYLSMLPPLVSKTGNGALVQQLGDLRTAMEQATPDAVDVAKKARAASSTLQGLINRAAGMPALEVAQLRDFAKAFAENGQKRAPAMDWDDATQLYLSLAAMHNALSDRGDPAATSGRLRPGLLPIKQRLRGAFKPGVDSPQFNPIDPPPLADQLKALRDLLGN